MQFTSKANNYTLGRGQIFFAPFLPGTKTAGAEMYFGNTPEFKINTTSEQLEHFSAEAGIKEVDESATLKTTRKMTLKTDNVSKENLALLFLGEALDITSVAATVAAEPIAANRVRKDAFIKLGVTPSNLSGAFNVTEGSVVVKAGAVTYVEGTDFEVIYASGIVHILPGGSIADNVALTIDRESPAYTRTQVISGSTPIAGQIRFVSENAVGANHNYFIPYARMSPNGEFALKGDTWQELDFMGDVLKLTPSTPAVLIDGVQYIA